MTELVLYKNNQIDWIGDYEPDLFVKFMSKYRKFNKDKIIDYLMKIYDVPYTYLKPGTRFDELLNKHCKQETDIFADYYKENDYRCNDNSRKFFNSKGRKAYLDFADRHFDTRYCYLSGVLFHGHVH